MGEILGGILGFTLLVESWFQSRSHSPSLQPAAIHSRLSSSQKLVLVFVQHAASFLKYFNMIM